MLQEERDRLFIKKTILLALQNVQEKKGGPFAAIVTKGNEIIAEGTNIVTTSNDPTAHAEITAIRNACNQLNSFQLEGCTIYSSCEPCPMCLGAIYWARPSRLIFAANKHQAAKAGFDDAFIYNEITLPYIERHLETIHYNDTDSEKPFDLWKMSNDKINY